MIDATITLESMVVYLTALKAGEVWVSGTFEEFVTPGRTQGTDSAVILPTDRRALREEHHRGAVMAQRVYAVPEGMILGEMGTFASLNVLQTSPDHGLREEHIHQILESLSDIADNYLVTL